MPVPSVGTIQKASQAVIAPEMQAVKDRLSGIEGQIVGLKGELGGEIRALQSEIRRLDDKVDNLRNELKADIARLDEKLTFTNKRLDEALEIRERLATLEAKLRQ